LVVPKIVVKLEMAELPFAGRQSELAQLAELVEEATSSKTGRLLVVRGRRQVGKSTLIETFCARTSVPSAFFTAARRQPAQASLAEFADVVARSRLGQADAVTTGFTGWEQALNIATASDTPSIVVIDELPWLLEMDEAIEGLLQRVWDRVLRKRPVVLILIGSDLAMMDALSEYGRPLYDRTKILRVDPLTPSDVADLTGLGSADAIEAWALTGGFPNVVRSWPAGGTATDFLSTQLPDPSSALVVSGERKVAAEFPADAFARPVLDAIGSGTREHGKISQKSGLGGSSLERALALLVEKRAIVRERPYSTDLSKLTHYRIEDAHLRVWGRYISPNMPAIERGAGNAALQRVLTDWEAWKGEAVEPIIRESVLRLALRDESLSAAAQVGRWWRRDGQTEVDIVIGDRLPTAKSLLAIGSIKWRQTEPFGTNDLRELSQSAAQLPGAEGVELVAVSRIPARVDGLARLWAPDDLLDAWR
jgi:uncharacterized protein